jgi:circadian clock protein KaiC
MDPQRVSTGIAGLDILLHGGYLRGRTYLVTGDTGTGKTISCLQFLVSGLKHGEKAVYVTVDERPGEILESAASFSWDLQPHIQEKSLVILDASPYFGGRSGSATEKGIDPQKIVADLGNYARRLSATLLIIDPITPLILPNDATSPSQDQARSLVQLIQTQLTTTNLFTAHLASPTGWSTSGGIEQYLTSGVLLLKTDELNGKFNRTLTLKKMRGTPVEPGDFSFAIAPGDGIVLTNRPAREAMNCRAPMFELFDLSKRHS